MEEKDENIITLHESGYGSPSKILSCGPWRLFVEQRTH